MTDKRRIRLITSLSKRDELRSLNIVVHIEEQRPARTVDLITHLFEKNWNSEWQPGTNDTLVNIWMYAHYKRGNNAKPCQITTWPSVDNPKKRDWIKCTTDGQLWKLQSRMLHPVKLALNYSDTSTAYLSKQCTESKNVRSQSSSGYRRLRRKTTWSTESDRIR